MCYSAPPRPSWWAYAIVVVLFAILVGGTLGATAWLVMS